MVKFRPLSQSLDYKIYRLSLLLERELRYALKPYDLSVERWQVLATVWEHPNGVNQSQIAHITLKDKPSVSRLVAAMIKAGWLIRTHHKRDSRAYLVKASNRALNKKKEILGLLYRHFENLQKGLQPGSKDQMMTLVLEYSKVIESHQEESVFNLRGSP